MNRIMTSGVAAAAFAASALFALPAAADPPAAQAKFVTRAGDDARLVVRVDHRDRGDAYRTASYSRRGYQGAPSNWQTQRLRRAAIQACRAGIGREARRIGYRDIDFDSRGWARQIGPQGFRVHFNEIEFEGRRHEFERSVTCTVRHGRVTDIDGIPHARGGPRYGRHR